MTTSNPVRRIAGIVDAIAASRQGLTLVEIAEAVDLPLSTAHRTVNILIDIGYVKLEPSTKLYKIGDRLKRVFGLTLGNSSLKELAQPELAGLAEHFSETAYVTQLTTSGIELVDFYLPTRGSRTLVHPGFDFPMHATAAGKVIYAFQPPEVLEAEFAKERFERFMPNTIVDKKLIRKELEATRARGYAINDVELDPGIYAVAAPIRLGEAGVVGAIAIAGIRERIFEHFTTEEVAEALCAAADKISSLTYQMIVDDRSKQK